MIDQAPSIDISSYGDMVTVLLLGLFVLLAGVVAIHRSQFGQILQALLIVRKRSQLLRQTKLVDEWLYVVTLFFNLSVQSVFVFLLIVNFFPQFAIRFYPIVLFIFSFLAVSFDCFIKMLNARILGTIYDCVEDVMTLRLHKFFYQTANSVFLFMMLVCYFYLHNWIFICGYIAIFGVNYCLMFYRTLTLKTHQVNLFQFFLYFCTLEILPYIVLLKLLLSI